MDAFSEVLSSLKLQGALFFTAEFSAPWAIATPASKALASALGPRCAPSRGLPPRSGRRGPRDVARRTHAAA